MASRNSKKKTASSNGTAVTSASGGRVSVLKTYKLYIGGAFVRSESEREYSVSGKEGTLIAHVCRATRKDLRNAVVAARKAQEAWSERTPYLRAQILYRVAEMLESRRSQFEHELVQVGLTPKAAAQEVSQTIDCAVHFSGWADKCQHLLGAINPVSGKYFNFSTAEPIGIVAVVAPEEPSLLGLVRSIMPALCLGNAVIVLAAEDTATIALSFAEVLATSDVPGGVVNILAGQEAELIPHVGSHMDIHAICYARDSESSVEQLRSAGRENLKRIVVASGEEDPLTMLGSFAEIRTTWHPVAT